MEMEARETIVDQQPQGTSFGRTCLNGINSLSGVGILSMPYVLSQGGWGSLSLLLLIATVYYYTGLLLQRCMDVNENIRTYPDIAYEAYGNIGRVCLTSVLYLEFYLVAVEFLILEEKGGRFPPIRFKRQDHRRIRPGPRRKRMWSVPELNSASWLLVDPNK